MLKLEYLKKQFVKTFVTKMENASQNNKYCSSNNSETKIGKNM